MHTNVCIYRYLHVSDIVMFFLLSNSKYPFSHCKKSVIKACFWHTVVERESSSLLMFEKLESISGHFLVCKALWPSLQSHPPPPLLLRLASRTIEESMTHPVFLPFFLSFLFLLNKWEGLQKKETGNMEWNVLFLFDNDPKNLRHSTLN